MESWTATKEANGHWLFVWDAGSSDPFDIWLNGELLETAEGGEYDCVLDGYDDVPPPLEIVADDSAITAENESYPPYAILQWREVEGADGYLVEQYVSGTWVSRKSLRESGAGYYWFRTAVLDDQEEVVFRVSATDSVGNAGTPLSFTFSIVRNPAPPEVSFEMDSGDLVVGEA